MYPVASTTLFPNSSLGKAWAVRGKTSALLMCFTSPTLYVEERADAAAGFTSYGMGEPRTSVAVGVCITCRRWEPAWVGSVVKTKEEKGVEREKGEEEEGSSKESETWEVGLEKESKGATEAVRGEPAVITLETRDSEHERGSVSAGTTVS